MRIDSKEFIFSVVIFISYLLATFTNNTIIQIVAACLFLLPMLFLEGSKSFLLLVCLAPNITMMTMPYIGVKVLGVGFAILFIKLSVFNSIETKYAISFGIVLLITLLRIKNGNIYDTIQFLLVAFTFFTCVYVVGNDLVDSKEIIYSFRIGCIYMMIGMVIQFILLRGAETRLRAISDDCNYTATMLMVLFIMSLLSFGYKLELKDNFVFLVISGIMGLSTGSRGFLLVIGIIVIMLTILGLIKKEARKITGLVLFALVTVVIMYFLNVSFVVKIYDETIGRTLELQKSHVDGEFMDVTSGRMFLWKYYLNNMICGIKELLFGTGFYNYYFEENGGNGLAVHNMYISGIIGVGVIGLLILLTTYFSFIRQSLFNVKSRVFLLIPIGVLIEYFFLDGLFDLRIIIYLILTISLVNVYKDKVNSEEDYIEELIFD